MQTVSTVLIQIAENMLLTTKNYQIFSLRPDSAAQREFSAPLNAKQVIAIRSPIRYVSRNNVNQYHDQMKGPGLNYL